MPQRLSIMLQGGSGQVSVSPDPSASGLYATGTMVTILCIPDGGFTFVNWTVKGNEVADTAEFVLEIGRSDIALVGNLSGAPVADFDYGLRLYSEYCTGSGKTRLAIEEKEFSGEAMQVPIADLIYQIGEFDSDPTDLFITSRVEWAYWIEDNFPDLRFLLTLDPRRFRVTYYRGYVDDSTFDFIWKGYLKTNFVNRPLYRTRYKMSFVATDGIKDLEGYRVFVPSVDRTDAATIIAGLLNQTWKDGLKVRECVRVFENRMNQADTDSLFSQFTLNADALYDNNDQYQEEGTLIIFNPGKTVLDALEHILRSFVCRLYQWNGHWYIVRVQEYTKTALKFIEFTKAGAFDSSFSVANDQDFECLSNPEENGANDYTEFNAVLNLGSINKPETRQIIADNFSVLSWYNPNPGRPSTNPTPGNTLKFWDYVNAVVWDGTLESEYARIERISNPSTGQQGDYVRIWCTANGVADPLLSGLSYRSYLNNTAVKNAQVLSIQAKFQVVRRGSADSSVPPPGSHFAAIRVQVGSSFLEYDGLTTFSWGVDPNALCLFEITNAGVWNIIDIRDLEVPEDGSVQLMLCQLITVTGTRHRYKVDWEDVAVNLNRNDALTYKAVEAKSVTDTPYSSVYPKYDTYIGDAFTNLSSSAIILKDEAETPVSESWNRQEFAEEEEKLLGVILQDLVNTYGKNNFTYNSQIRENEDGSLDFSKGLKYKGTFNILTAAKLDDFSGIWNFQFFKLAEGTGLAVINWELAEYVAEGMYIDANTRIYVNEVQQVEAFGNSTGSFTCQVGDTIRVQYFYLGGLYAGSPVDPRLVLTVGGVEIASHPLVLANSSTFNYSFAATEGSTSVIVSSTQG